MPGILPMKVIKVGTSAQSRIAQACDRCRSKKIRCDGVTPCCSQCANVGFECKTSDKLSRRAFPRGYTESLEERVRALESEVRELKDLLDEKDEKIDLLSKIHSFTPARRPSASASSSSMASMSSEPPPPVPSPAVKAEEDVFKVQQSPFLLESEKKSDSYFMGASSGRSFVDAFRSKVQESGKSTSNFNIKSLFGTCSSAKPTPKASTSLSSPPRLVSDQMINIFFQEWAPLFPILHRPTFLKLYGDFVADPTAIKDQQSIAQLYLVFGIAALSSETNKQDIQNFEIQWQTALDSIMYENTFTTLQSLVLAQIYCINKADYKKLLFYTGVAVNLSHRLGLHQSQKRFSLGALTRESRKKVFWTLYTLDCFSAALLGLPKLMRDEDIYTEEPSDVDDENVTERGFQPTLPGESTKLSSALALFRAARVLSKVLAEVYPAATSHELSLQKIAALSEELDEWRNGLAPHLRLRFVQDKPSTNVVSSRSPLLSLAYYYIRTLIHRPVVSSDMGSKASSSVVAVADSSKHIIQIVQLLEERRMTFSFCLNKNELLVLSGFGLLFQNLDLKEEGKLIKDSQRLVCSVVDILERSNAYGAASFKKVACSLIAIEHFTKRTGGGSDESAPRKSSDGRMSAPQSTNKSTKKQLQAIASRFSFGSANRLAKEEFPAPRRSTAATIPAGNLALYARAGSQISLSSVQSEPVIRRLSSGSTAKPTPPASSLSTTDQTNLDYLSFNNDPTFVPDYSTTKQTPVAADWDHLLGYIDDSTLVAYDSTPSYVSADFMVPQIDVSPSLDAQDWSPESWGLNDTFSQNSVTAHSVFSLSEESLTSGEEVSSVEFSTEYRGYAMPNPPEEYRALEVLEGSFGL